MKFKTVIALAASLTFFTGSAIAADQKHSQRWDKNKQSSQTHKVKQSDEQFKRIVDMKYDRNQRQNMHPVHQNRMGDH